MIQKVLLVYYSIGGETEKAAKVVAEELRKEGLEVKQKNAFEADKDDMIDCDILVVGTPDYFSSMAGGIKDFFDRCWYPAKNSVAGKPYAAFVTCGGVGLAVRSVVCMCRRYQFRKLTRPVVVETPLREKELHLLQLFGKRIAGKARLLETPLISSRIHRRILFGLGKRIRKMFSYLYRL